MADTRPHDVAPLTVPSVDTGEAAPSDASPRENDPSGTAEASAELGGRGGEACELDRGMRTGQTEIGPRNDPND